MELPEDMLDPSLYEFVVDAIDGLLEEADMFLDEAQGKKSHDEVRCFWVSLVELGT
jgi:hypothetical protein